MQPCRGFVECHARVTIWAVAGPSTVVTHKRGSEATPIQEDQNLAPSGKRGINLLYEFGRQAGGQIQSADVDLQLRGKRSTPRAMC